MTPKEKAIELYDKYWTLISYKIEGSVGRLVIKQCALIAVDEIIKAGKDVDEFADSYWYEVKQEIESL